MSLQFRLSLDQSLIEVKLGLLLMGLGAAFTGQPIVPLSINRLGISIEIRTALVIKRRGKDVDLNLNQ